MSVGVPVSRIHVRDRVIRQYSAPVNLWSRRHVTPVGMSRTVYIFVSEQSLTRALPNYERSAALLGKVLCVLCVSSVPLW